MIFPFKKKFLLRKTIFFSKKEKKKEKYEYESGVIKS